MTPSFAAARYVFQVSRAVVGEDRKPLPGLQPECGQRVRGLVHAAVELGVTQSRVRKRGHEQFCAKGQMIGKHRDGGYAEFIKVPGRSVFVLPDEIPFEHGAIMMCSSATALHALNKARLRSGDSVAIFGFGGLGFSALQLARGFGCREIYVVDINPAKLASIAAAGGIAIDAIASDPVEQIREATGGKGVDVSIELVGSATTMGQAVRCLGIFGRAALVGLTAEAMSVLPYTEIINKEAEIIGVSDHLATELSSLMQLACSGKLCFPQETLRFVDLDAAQINASLDAVENSADHTRTVIVPRRVRRNGDLLRSDCR